MPADVVLILVVAVSVSTFGIHRIGRSHIERDLAMASLSRSQRREIWKAVNTGNAVHHPELAASAIELARKLQQRQRRTFSLPSLKWKATVGVVLGVVGLISLVTGQWVTALYCGLFVPCIVFGDEVLWNPIRRKRAASIAANGG